MGHSKYLALLFVVLFWGCDQVASKKGALIDFVPQDSDVVLRISNFETLQSDLKNSALLSAFNKTDLHTYFTESHNLFKYLNPKGESFLALSTRNDSVTDYTFVTRQDTTVFSIDSIANRSIETLKFDGISLQRINIDNNTAYSATQDSVFIASSSQQMVATILKRKNKQAPEFKKAISVKENSELTAVVNNPKAFLNDSTTINFATTIALDLSVLPNALTATGVALARDTVPQFLTIFEGQVPQQNDLEQLIPTTAKTAVSYTYNDATELIKHIQPFQKFEAPEGIGNILSSVNELGEISLKEGHAIVLKSIDADMTTEALARYVSENSIFRETLVYDFNQSDLFYQSLNPLISTSKLSQAFQLNGFFVISENEAVTQAIITAYKNNDVLGKAHYFEDASAQLSNASSILMYKMGSRITDAIAPYFSSETHSEITAVSLSKYPLALLQFTYDRDFAHVNLVCKEASTKKQQAGTVSELFSMELENTILGEPQLFTNHRTNGKNIVVQDIGNKLYFISEQGRTLWTKKLNNPILGNIQEVDILRNGKKQLAFVTKNNFYVLDRNGNNVAPFPLQFKDDFTQPLSVFDYGNNRKYRFIITQGKELFMYNNSGNIVKGFTFKKAKSNIVLPPQHIRMGNKDYIVIAEENGHLNILHRTGKVRVPLSRKFEFSEIPIEEEKNNFVVITKDNNKISISQTGKTTTQTLDVSNSYGFTVNGNVKATMDDNLLRINGKLVELPFGIYTRPKISVVNRNKYITTTETQESKVYVFNAAGELLNGFPVYGTSTADLGRLSSKNTVGLVVKGSDKEVILYAL
ncbi:hypothetical protein [Marixanthomonas spongiae]|uniref:Uncharacterized protein n=1 Tax=Marixanthomonas spongiae TaxID=2174845 RepID=A0A2U0HTK3_9FLAO|nr:hypothetical protein [Marixanthomonas spongiae]PVW12159.1 hypothetical protein DDV96_15265 [Marixanthomonas spongiae]